MSSQSVLTAHAPPCPSSQRGGRYLRCIKKANVFYWKMRHAHTVTRLPPSVEVCCCMQSQPHVSQRADEPCDTLIGRRALLYGCTTLVVLSGGPRAEQAQALGFQKELKKKKIPLEDYSTSDDGMKYFDLIEGSGNAIERGTKVTVHFDCFFRGIDAVSSRSARLLAGNRAIAEPFAFVAGKSVDVKVIYADENANGLFTGGGGPKPPPILSSAVLGMKKGGKRSVIVPPELGYGSEGMLEIPPGATFEMQVEVLEAN